MPIKTYGQQITGKQPSEANEMTTFFNQLKKRYPEIHALALHVRNEGKRDHKDTNIMKMQGGFIKGAPDIVIAGSPTFLCEMKSKAKSSRTSKEQDAFLERAYRAGCFCCVAYGWEAAIEAVEEWKKEGDSWYIWLESCEQWRRIFEYQKFHDVFPIKPLN